MRGGIDTKVGDAGLSEIRVTYMVRDIGSRSAGRKGVDCREQDLMDIERYRLIAFPDCMASVQVDEDCRRRWSSFVDHPMRPAP